jgi:hypothetical protein
VNNRAVHILIHRCGPFAHSPELGIRSIQRVKIDAKKVEADRGATNTPTGLSPTRFATRREGLTVILPRHPDDGATSNAGASVTPIGIPSRHDLWQRLVLARAVLGHRPPNAVTAALLLRILDGEQLNSLAAGVGLESE